MTLVTMSKEEFSRVAVLQDLQVGRLGVGEAAALLGVTRRHVFRMRKAFLAEGPAALASRLRGKPGNRRAPDDIRRQVLSIIRTQCNGLIPPDTSRGRLSFPWRCRR